MSVVQWIVFNCDKDRVVYTSQSKQKSEEKKRALMELYTDVKFEVRKKKFKLGKKGVNFE